MERGQLITLAARPSVGKSALALNLALEAAMLGAKVAYFSLEMTQNELMDRILARITRTHATRFKYANIQDSVLEWGFRELEAMPGKIMVEVPSGKNFSQILRQAEFMHQHAGLDLLILDHIDLILEPIRRNENESSAIARMTSSLKDFANRKNSVVIALSQFNRESRGEMPEMHQLRGSGAKEQDSDVVLILHRDTKDPDAVDFREARLRIAKNRNGQLGDIPLRFYPEFTYFEEL